MELCQYSATGLIRSTIEFALAVRRHVIGRPNGLLCLWSGHAGELRKERQPSFVHCVTEIPVMVGEVPERPRGRKLLPLKEQRQLRARKQQRGESTPLRLADVMKQPVACSGVGNLIVILQKADERCGGKTEGIAAARLALPRVPLTLVKEAMPRHRRKLAGGAFIIGEVGLAASRQRHGGRVVPVVVPDGVQSILIGASVMQKSRVLRFAFTDQKHSSSARGHSGGAAHRSEERRVGKECRS